MRLSVTLVAAIAIAVSSTVTIAQEALRPLLTISIKNHRTFATEAARLVNAIEPGKGDSMEQEFRDELGSPELAGIDDSRPWQFAVWFKGMGVPPVLATYIPVTDFAAFESGLQPGKILRGKQNQNQIVSAGKNAIVIHRKDADAAISESDRASIQKSAESVSASEAHTIHLNLQMDDAVRMQVMSTLAMGKMMIDQTFSNPQFANQGGFNPAAMSEMVGLYFQMIEGTVQGLARLDVEADVTPENIVIYKRVTPVAGSDLAEWLGRAEGGLAAVTPFLDPKAPMAFAMRLNAGPGALEFMKKAVRLSFQMQNQTEDEETVRQTDELMRALLPMVFAGSIGFEKGYQFAGVYEIPGGDTAKTYGQLLDWMKLLMDLQVGSDKMYSSFELKRGARKIGDVAVDRATIGLNLESPAFQSPQQKKMLETMWPGGKMQIEYALKESRLYMATGDSIEKSMTPFSTSPILEVDSETVLAGHVNLVALVKGTLSPNPLVPAEVQDKFRQLDPAGLAMRFKVNVDGRLKSESRIPLKLLSALGQLR